MVGGIPAIRTRMAQHVVAIDIDADLLSLARRRVSEAGLTNWQFIVADAYDLRANIGAPVDFVFLANAFHGVPDKQRLCNPVAETLLPGGQFAVVNRHQEPKEETTVLGQPRGPK